MKRVLCLVSSYPDNNGAIGLMYVHSRNVFYLKHDIDVTVLRFDCNEDYIIDGVKVISLQSYEKNGGDYDVLIVHAPNLKYHYRFLKKYEKRFPKIIMFFHGHEVLKISKYYPKPYDYMEDSFSKRIMHDSYDKVKLLVWHRKLQKLAHKTQFVFVSNNYKKEALESLRLTDKMLKDHVHVIYNCAGKTFQESVYDHQSEKTYDFVVIRGVLDSSATCIDLVTGLARKYPQYSFLLIGKGGFFDHNEKPKNITWLNRYMNHGEVLSILNTSRCALNLTRRDTQGVMTCEFASIGMPVITSDLTVCKEVCDGLHSAIMVPNDVEKIDLEAILKETEERKPYPKSTKYDFENTVLKEVRLINE